MQIKKSGFFGKKHEQNVFLQISFPDAAECFGRHAEV